MLAVRPLMSDQRSGGSASYVGSKTLYVESYEGVRVYLMLAVSPFVSNQRCKSASYVSTKQ